LAGGGSLSITGAGETLSGADCVSLTVADGGAPAAVARGGTSLAARGDTEPLAVSAGGGTSSVADDDPRLLFDDGVELLAAARGDTLGAAIGGQTLLVAAGGAAPCSLNGGGGASESGGASDVWQLALSRNQTPATNKPRANSAAFFIRVLQITLTEGIDRVTSLATLRRKYPRLTWRSKLPSNSLVIGLHLELGITTRASTACA
jgi:hypothetical protein